MAAAMPGFMDYINLYVSTCAHHRHQSQAIQHVVDVFIPALEGKTLRQVTAGAEAGNADDIMDLALRTCTGCCAPKSKLDAARVLERVVAESNPFHLSRSLRGRGFSLMAYLSYGESRRVTPTPEALHAAAAWANAAAGVGFVSQLSLEIAHLVACPAEGRPASWAAEFDELVRAWRHVQDERTKKAGRREAHLQANRNLYFCAAPACGIEATHKACLSRCNGRCRPEGKPSYCSKECQRKDWKRHKQFCRVGGPIDGVVAAIRDGTDSEPDGEGGIRAEDFSHGPPEDRFIPRSADAIGSGKHERKMNFRVSNGNTVQMSSSTITPDMFREIQAELDRIDSGESEMCDILKEIIPGYPGRM